MYSYAKERHLFRHLLVGITFVVLSVTVTLIPSHVRAYKSLPQDNVQNPKLPGSSTIIYYYPDHLQLLLSISSTGTNFVNALNQWNDTSWYSLFDIGLGGTTVTQTTNRIYAVNFSTGPATPCGVPPNTLVGFACPGNVSILINSNSKWFWTNNGTLAGTYSSVWNPLCGCYPLYVHYLSASLHEIGHIFGSAHPTPSAPVMYQVVGNKPTLTEDDKRGPAQFYGPYTGWETADTTGNTSWVAYQSNVSSPTLVDVSAESGVTPYSGSRYIRLAGTANANYSYAYMKLLSADNDELGSNPRHLTIVNGTILSWRQYNHTQKRMSVDIAFTDGTVLRDTGLTDQNGICVHPACRASYNTGVWYYFTVNLSSLAGKRVKDIMIAYDNGNNGPTGAYKSYIDDLRITY